MSLRVLCPARSSQPQKWEASTDEVTRQSGFPDLHNSVSADTRSFQDRVILFPPLAKAAASCLTSLEQSARAILMDVVSTLTTSFFCGLSSTVHEARRCIGPSPTARYLWSCSSGHSTVGPADAQLGSSHKNLVNIGGSWSSRLCGRKSTTESPAPDPQI